MVYRYDVKADIICYGKTLGGGLPVQEANGRTEQHKLASHRRSQINVYKHRIGSDLSNLLSGRSIFH